MARSLEHFKDNPRLALTELRDRLSIQEREAERTWMEWKDDPLMKDIAADANRYLGALRHTIAALNADTA